MDDIDNLVDYFIDTNDDITYSGMYIDPQTFELYELKHL